MLIKLNQKVRKQKAMAQTARRIRNMNIRQELTYIRGMGAIEGEETSEIPYEGVPAIAYFDAEPDYNTLTFRGQNANMALRFYEERLIENQRRN